MTLAADYFDGYSSRRYDVALQIDDGVALLTGDIERRCSLAQLHVSELLGRQARKVTFPDGAFLIPRDAAAFAVLLAATGHRDSLVVRAQRSLSGILTAVVLSIGALAGGYVYGLPAVANIVARLMPESANLLIGREALAFIDQHLMQPSVLTAAAQRRLTARFKALVPPINGAPPYTLVFRNSKIGPNAFALPAGEIVLTDQLETLMDDPDAIMAVLSHELGHLHQRHMMRRLIQSAAVGSVTATLFGDVSSLLVTMPTVLLDMRYSRDAETEADDYAIAMMQANGISLTHMIEGFERIRRLHPDGAGYLSSHPLTADRIARIRAAQAAH